MTFVISILDVTGCVASLLLGLALVLPELWIALLVGRAAIVFRLPCVLPRILPDVTSIAALLGLLRSPAMPERAASGTATTHALAPGPGGKCAAFLRFDDITTSRR
jgi:hypothetical protein